MFSNTRKFHISLEQALEGDLDPMFDSFHKKLKSISIDTNLVVAHGLGTSSSAVSVGDSAKRVPNINIYVSDEDNYKSLEIDVLKNNWSSTYHQTEKIREMWKESLVEYDIGLDEYYDSEMLVFFTDLSKLIKIEMVYKYKKEVIDKLKKVSFSEVNVYCCSEPAYRIVYDTESEYRKANKQGEFDRVMKTICNFINQRIEELNLSIKVDASIVKFYHKKMPAYNGYGFFRED